ncbi:fungal-specific transcription factor domain-containing protein [Ilyonectria sp. MPI-CAGE-AT-0026]|nr:fungal-specific transcription factor domain-containing protein [Ilyonectria sp. MPI-CAGE-AT-0026]
MALITIRCEAPVVASKCFKAKPTVMPISKSKRSCPGSSCDRCRQQKTKCTKTHSGSCRRCLQAGLSCVTSNTRMRRPYYQSSKEQYDLMSIVVQHFVPGATLDTQSLQEIVAKIHDDHPPHSARTSENIMPFPDTLLPPPDATLQACLDASFLPAAASVSGGTAGKTNLEQSAPDTPATSLPVSWNRETSPVEGVPREDVMGITRYDSGTSWTSFFSRLHTSHYPGVVLQPFSLDDMKSSKEVDLICPDSLPSRADFERAASAFFTEINCVNYILSYDQFNTYMNKAFDTQPSITHAVHMLLCLILSFDDKYKDYFFRACKHVDYAMEEGSLASVEALMLIVLCRLNRGQRNLAWVTLGCASRIAQSLGLHLHESCWNETSLVTVESRKRLWWSLYDLDLCLTYRLGRYPGIDPALCHVSTPNEMLFNLIPNTPPDYHKTIAELSKLTGYLMRDLYGPGSADICLDDRADEILCDLACFWENLPEHLKPDATLAPCHSRAVHCLALRYNYAILLATRPSIVSCWKNSGSGSARLMHRVALCEDANRKSLSLLTRMVPRDLSRHNFLDASYILANILIFILRLAREPSLELLAQAEEYRQLLTFTHHLNIGRITQDTYDTAVQEVKSRSLINSHQHPQTHEHATIDDLQGFMSVDEFLWPAWLDPQA